MKGSTQVRYDEIDGQVAAELRAERSRHPEGCSCERCIRREGRMVAVERKVNRELDAEERAVAEAEHWAATGEQRIASAERDSALRHEEQIDRILERTEAKNADHLRTMVGIELKAETQRREPNVAETRRYLVARDFYVKGLKAADELRNQQERCIRQANKARVVAEPRVYAPDSPFSYFEDLAARITEPDTPKGMAAEGRFARYDAELAYEVRRGSEEGRRVLRLIKEETRSAAREDIHRRVYAEREARALTTGGGATASAGSGAAAFVSPFFILTDWAPYRGVYRSFADQCHQWPMPAYGMRVDIPTFSSGTSASQQTEGSGVSRIGPEHGAAGRGA